jgi:hypothetical protein
VSDDAWYYREPPAERRERTAEEERETADKARRAVEIWQTRKPLKGSPGEAYLRGRGLMPDAVLYHDSATTSRRGKWIETRAGWPETLAWSEDALLLPTAAKPALVAAVSDSVTGLVVAVHRIFFNRTGHVELKPDGKKSKISLGPIVGNAFRGSCWPDPQGRWGVAEGVESAMAATQLKRIPVWAAISAGNMPHVMPPSWARHVTIFADDDDAGIAAAASTFETYSALHGIEAVEIGMPKIAGCNDQADVLESIPYVR